MPRPPYIPADSVKAITDQTSVTGGQMFSALLYVLSSPHHWAFMDGKAETTGTVFEEIAATLQRFNRLDNPPKSVLEYLAMVSQFEAQMGAHNTKVYREGSHPDADAVAKDAACFDALRRVLQEVVNRSEQLGLATSMAIEKDMRDHPEHYGKAKPPTDPPTGG